MKKLGLGFVFCMLCTFCFLGLNLNFGQVNADVSNTITYTEVATLEELNTAVEGGNKNIDITTQIEITEDTVLDGINFYYNQDRAITSFNIAATAHLTIKNSTVTSNAVYTLEYADELSGSERVATITAEKNSTKPFITGAGDLTMENCEVSKINVWGKFIHITATEEDKATVNLLSVNFKDSAMAHTSNWGGIQVSYGTLNFGASDKTKKCTFTNTFGGGNGGVVLCYNSIINLYAIDIIGNTFAGNGYIAGNSGTKIYLHSGLFENNTGYAWANKGGWADIIHLYDRTEFHMLGGTIQNNIGGSCIIGTGRTGLTINLEAGVIKNNSSLTFESNPVFTSVLGVSYVGENMEIEGNIRCRGSTVTNEGKITGTVYVETEGGTPELINSGSINGGVQMESGTFNNSGDFEGTVDMVTGTVNNEGTMDSDITIQNGEFNNSGTVTGTLLTKQSTEENVENYCSVVNNGDMDLSINMQQGTITNYGELNGQATILGGLIDNQGTLNAGVLINGGEFQNKNTMSGSVEVLNGSYTNSSIQSGVVTNNGGRVTIEGNGTVFGTVTNNDGVFTNSGIIDANVSIKGGEVTNNGSMDGSLVVEGGSMYNVGVCEGRITIDEDVTFVNDGEIEAVVSGEITGSGTVKRLTAPEVIQVIIITSCIGVFLLVAAITIIILRVIRKKRGLRKI
ncbi:MAG: hypothetical protein IJZ26_01235 [Clostridia bacterium]|nr:hypothetical protein [Clostridia bacterium]